MISTSRRRTALGLALLGTVALGLASRLFRTGVPLWDENLGDALYAAAVYLVLGLVLPAASAPRLAAIAFGLCTAIEAFQLTGIPMRLKGYPAARWLLGTSFAWHDFLCYSFGVAVIMMLDLACLTRATAPTPGRSAG